MSYRCHPSYSCRCFRDEFNDLPRVVSLSTAILHRRKAMDAAEDHGKSCFFPMPSQVPAAECVPGPTSPIVLSSASNDLQPLLPSPIQLDPINYSSSPSIVCLPAQFSPSPEVQLPPSPPLPPPFQTINLGDPLPSQVIPSTADIRLKETISKYSWIPGLAIEHHGTEAMLDDLVKLHNKKDPRGMPFKSFKGLRESLIRASGIETSLHACCIHGHQALQLTADLQTVACPYRNCTTHDVPSSIGSFEYIKIWPQLHAMVQSAKFGPMLYDHFREGISSASKTPDYYEDFYSGSVFGKVADMFGGIEEITNDIFLHLSTDGVQPFESNEYSYWPVLLIIANLPPSERYKIDNMLMTMAIPGSRTNKKGPSDICSFLKPLLDEISALSKDGVTTTMWNGEVKRIRVHLLFVQLDLEAVKRLCYLTGYNGRAPCRFCYVLGIWVPEHNHMYYPPRVTASLQQSNEEKMIKVLWDPENLPMRTDVQVRAAYDQLKQTGGEAAKHLRQINGFSKHFPSPLLDVPTIEAFFSFPVDIMHLLYGNVAPFLCSLWLSKEPEYQDIAIFSSTTSFNAVNSALKSSGRGIPSSISRKPRGLECHKSWKSTEWKTFVITTSLAVLHEWVPKNILSGWHLFVQICELVSEWNLTADMVDEVERLSIAFFDHYNNTYYQLRRDRLKLCRYVFHLLLHLADSIRANGPISMLAQWSTETFAGLMNRRCNATDRFAESVLENAKLSTAVRTYGLINDIPIELSSSLPPRCDSDALSATSNMEQLEGYILRHPRTAYSIQDAEHRFPNLWKLMKRYYMHTMQMDSIGAERLLRKFNSITVWERCEDEKCSADRSFVYRAYGARESDSATRSACYFVGVFGDSQELHSCYGRALGFIEHLVSTERRFIVVASWVTRGLHVGDQRQVYAKKGLAASDLFPVVSLESVHCIAAPISVIETEVPNKTGRLSKRTYFIDSMREKLGILTRDPWDPATNSPHLMGLVRVGRKRSRNSMTRRGST